MNNKLIWPAFFLMSLLQLFVPANMIFQKEAVLTSGKAFKFKTAPVDPNDPFRGKYISLSFEENSFRFPGNTDLSFGDEVFVRLVNDSLGFAKIHSVSRQKPDLTDDYVKATLQYVISDSISFLQIQYPFDRFYMEESKAPAAEHVYTESVLDSAMITYALVFVKKGDAVIKDVMINETSIRDLARDQIRENH